MVDSSLEEKGKVKVEVEGEEAKKEEAKKGEEGYVPAPDLEKKESEVKKEEPKELQDEDVLKFLSKREGREIKSFDDLAVETIVEKKIEYASEQSADIDNYIRATGRTAKDWWDTQSTDYTSMSSEQLIKEDIKARFPKLTSKQVDIYYNDEFHVDSEKFEEDEVAVAEVKLEMKAKKILDNVLEIQNKFKKPIETKAVEHKKEAPEDTDKNKSQKSKVDSEAEKRTKAKENWVGEAKTHLDSVEKLNVGKYEVLVDDETKEYLNKANSSLETFFVDNFRDEKGVWDRDRLNTILLLAKEGNLESVTGNIESNLLGKGAEGVIENRRNISLPGSKIKDKAAITKEQEVENKNFVDAVLEGFGK